MNIPIAALAFGLLLPGMLTARAQSNLVIESFELPGQIAFSKVTNALQYRIEWSGVDAISWTNFGLPELDAIVSPGVGLATASVPMAESMLYRIVATVTNPPSAIFTVVINDATNAYVINGQTNLALELIRGETYVFTIDTPGQPFWIKTRTVTGRGDAYTNGLSTNGISSGQITFDVPLEATNTLYYISQFRSALQGVIHIEDSPPPPTGPPNMALVSAGIFVMGNATNVFPASEGGNDELPQHTVTVIAFYMDQYEVTKALWDQVSVWASTQGYAMATGGGKATNHPVHSVNWHDAVKWCNARSEREGLTPVYYMDAAFTTVYRTGQVFEPFANWSANGYRLPTEAEWEKAARGGTADTRFPWMEFTNKISWAKANYFGRSSVYNYDLSGTGGSFHPNYDNGAWPWTSPVGSFAPNGFGLYDMAGNVQEWCWDWYDQSYYASAPGADQRGPASPVPGSIDETGPKPGLRVLRGGSWAADASSARIARRLFYTPESPVDFRGFRCVRNAP